MKVNDNKDDYYYYYYLFLSRRLQKRSKVMEGCVCLCVCAYVALLKVLKVAVC